MIRKKRHFCYKAYNFVGVFKSTDSQYDDFVPRTVRSFIIVITNKVK
jgi:hypothetical protein